MDKLELKPGMSYQDLSKAVKTHPDEHAANELHMYASNDSHLYHQSARPVIENLARKKAKGEYDHELAHKAWTHHADRAAKAYEKEHGGKGVFNAATRRLAAHQMRDHYHEEVHDRAKELSEAKVKKSIQPGQSYSDLKKSEE